MFGGVDDDRQQLGDLWRYEPDNDQWQSLELGGAELVVFVSFDASGDVVTATEIVPVITEVLFADGFE